MRRAKPHAVDAPGYSPAEALQWTNATKAQLAHWLDRRIIIPDIADTTGRGVHRRLSPLNLIEIQLATMMNEFRIPIAGIADGVWGLRDHHELCKAVRSAGPVEPTQKILTPEQRRAVELAYVQAFQRRDARFGKRSTPKQMATYAKAVKDSADIFSDDNQRLILHHAFAWYRFTREPAFRDNHFYGLFVFPDEEHTTIADEPLDLKTTIEFAAIVINLGPVVSFYTEAMSADLWR